MICYTVLTVIIAFIQIDFASTQLYTKSVNWNNRTNGNYTETMAKADFGPVSGWDSDVTRISSKILKITLKKNLVASDSGISATMALPNGTTYELSFDVKFDSSFDWSRGGKVGFGFGVGNGNTGCVVPIDGAGGSLRIMWYNDDKAGRVYFRPYIYHVDMPGPCGSNFNKTYPASGSLTKNTWYKVYMYIASNTGSSTNGKLKILINDVTLIDENFRWTTNDSKRYINSLLIHTFRGGNDDAWKSTVDSFMYFDNLLIKRLA